MEVVKNKPFYKIAYGAIFVLVLPILLFLWAKCLDSYIKLPIPIFFKDFDFSNSIIITSLFLGIFFLLGGWISLYKYGNGLPMNAFPPKKFVSQAVYSLLPHPIYTGFCFLTFGLFLLLQSPGGVWVVFPVVVLSCVSLLFGYEKEAIQKIFGNRKVDYVFKLPENVESKIEPIDYLRVYILVLLPWLIAYETVQYLGIPKDAFTLMLSFEEKIPIIEWTELIYLSVYPMVLLFPLFIRSKSSLREFAIHANIATIVCFLIYLVMPVVANQRPFISQSFVGDLLNFERSMDKPVCAFPSFHVIWAFICASYYSNKATLKKILLLWAILVSISCITTGMHSIADVLGGVVFYFLLEKRIKIWDSIRFLAEKIANSWSEVFIGKVRFINHGAWAAFGIFFGISFVFVILTYKFALSIVIVTMSGLICAGLWAQIIEGSSGLLRPYGYYGGVIGVIAGSLLSSFLFGNFWLLISAYALAAPIIQSFGRCRCLVQGCCHGKPVNESIGIRFYNPNSRVTRIGKLEGIYLHPTQVYSILWNIIIFAILVRLYFLNAEPNLISGLYLILTGLGRFVEESLRGEPQTKIIGGLRLYSWIAIITIVCGGLISSFPTGLLFPKPEMEFSNFSFPLILAGIIYCALGVDVPSSNKRFSRLT